MANVDIIRLAKECPGTIVSLQATDLAEAGRRLIDQVRVEVEKEARNKAASSLLTKEQVKQRLNVSETTLWRWKKCGYLIPMAVGGQLRYKSQDIEDIMEGRK